jgi:small subunit ribosomal protein S20
LPNIKSASKRLRQSQKRRQRNREIRSEIRTRTKKLLQTESPEEARQSFRVIASLLDKAARKGVVPRNTAARRKSRLERYVRRLGD